MPRDDLQPEAADEEALGGGDERARGIVEETLAGTPHRLRMKQLYHDREEITVWLAGRRERLTAAC